MVICHQDLVWPMEKRKRHGRFAGGTKPSGQVFPGPARGGQSSSSDGDCLQAGSDGSAEVMYRAL